jgi:hypothetical protein
MKLSLLCAFLQRISTIEIKRFSDLLESPFHSGGISTSASFSGDFDRRRFDDSRSRSRLRLRVLLRRSRRSRLRDRLRRSLLRLRRRFELPCLSFSLFSSSIAICARFYELLSPDKLVGLILADIYTRV